jgi:hypothetical protein
MNRIASTSLVLAAGILVGACALPASLRGNPDSPEIHRGLENLKKSSPDDGQSPDAGGGRGQGM